jgi:predicted aspartyl protease
MPINAKVFRVGDIVRVMCGLRFEKTKGWSKEYPSILDTGAPISVIPKSIWSDIDHNEKLRIEIECERDKALLISPDEWQKYKGKPDYEPPMPVLEHEYVKISSPYTDQPIFYPAEIDTGADRTCIPVEAIERLDLPVRGYAEVTAYQDLSPQDVPIVEATISIGDLRYEQIEVLAAQRETILIGRDILNGWTLLLERKEDRFAFSV